MAGDAPRGYGLVACCVDAPEGGASLDEAARIAALGGGRLVLVHVAEPPGRFSGGRTAWSPPEDELAAEIAAEARAWLQRMADEAGAADAVVLRGSDPPRRSSRGPARPAPTCWSSTPAGTASSTARWAA